MHFPRAIIAALWESLREARDLIAKIEREAK